MDGTAFLWLFVFLAVTYSAFVWALSVKSFFFPDDDPPKYEAEIIKFPQREE